VQRMGDTAGGAETMLIITYRLSSARVLRAGGLNQRDPVFKYTLAAHFKDAQVLTVAGV